ncbi:YgiQ family radical SAM protein [Planctomycetota bacterium]
MLSSNFDTSEAVPMTRAEMARRGWDALDVLLVTGDAYVDHPAFGAALLGRWLESHGHRVGIVAQPRWDRADDIARMGRPRLFVGVTAGALDSMLAHYTAFRKKRSDDAYTPGGKAGARPNRATIVYANLVRQAFPGVPVVIGGIEASMRRASHYDFWQDKVRRSILLDSKADVLVYGMGERAVLEVARRLRECVCGTAALGCERSAGDPAPTAEGGCATREMARRVLNGIRGTCFVGGERDVPEGAEVVRLPSHEEIQSEPRKLMEATLALEQQVHQGRAWAVQEAQGQSIAIAPPAEPLTTAELDELYALPFTRQPHPSYTEPIPAVEMIQFSVTTHRGCAGGCSFCSLALHQGRRIRSRSAESVVGEVSRLSEHTDWRGSLSDVGGPTANMWGAACQGDPAACRRTSCLTPTICGHFKPDQAALGDLLRAIDRLPGVKHLRVASGVRHDLAMREPDYVRALVREFVGGQLKLAPEHRCDAVLGLMRKPPFEQFERFLTLFERESAEAGKEQFVIPYLMSAFPGCTEDDMRELAAWLKTRGWRPQQVQCFIPTPGTVATAMYHAGIDPEGNPIPVARTDAERLRQHAILVPRPRSEGRRRHNGRPRRRGRDA